VRSTSWASAVKGTNTDKAIRDATRTRKLGLMKLLLEELPCKERLAGGRLSEMDGKEYGHPIARKGCLPAAGDRRATGTEGS
jgi:hypothetical protein